MSPKQKAECEKAIKFATTGVDDKDVRIEIKNAVRHGFKTALKSEAVKLRLIDPDELYGREVLVWSKNEGFSTANPDHDDSYTHWVDLPDTEGL